MGNATKAARRAGSFFATLVKRVKTARIACRSQHTGREITENPKLADIVLAGFKATHISCAGKWIS